MTDRPPGDVEGACPPRRRRRPRRWSKRRRTTFLEHLAESCNVSAAARVAGMDRSSAYDLKDKDPSFARGWRAALLQAHEALEWQLLEASHEGTLRTELQLDPKTRKPTQIKLVHTYPLMVTLRLFLSHRDEVAAHRLAEQAEPETEDEVIARIDAHMSVVRTRLLALQAGSIEDGDLAEDDDEPERDS